MLKIAASWVISPILGGSIAALILYAIMRAVVDQRDILNAARRCIPYLLAVMTWVFASYLALKWLKQLVPIDFFTASLVGLAAAVLVFLWVKPRIAAALGRSQKRQPPIHHTVDLRRNLAELCPQRKRRGKCGRSAGCHQ
jgi:PiT family inorganic phosphate transporter